MLFGKKPWDETLKKKLPFIISVPCTSHLIDQHKPTTGYISPANLRLIQGFLVQLSDGEREPAEISRKSLTTSEVSNTYSS